MLRRFFLSLLCLASLMPGCALLPGGSVPAAAQTPVAGQSAAGRFTPHPVAPVSRPVISRPVAAPPATPTSALQSQNSVLQSQLTAAQAQLVSLVAQDASLRQSLAIINGQNTALTSQNTALAARVAALIGAANAPPVAFGQPYASSYTDDTHLVIAHYQVSNTLQGVQGNPGTNNGVSGTVAGYLADIQEAAAVGIDGFALDAGDISSYRYLQNIANMFTAADQYNAAQKNPDGTYKNNGHGVTRFRLMLLPDFSGVGEDAASLTALAHLFVQCAAHPSCFTYQGRPVLGTYTGDGSGPGQTGAQAVAAVYPSLLSQIRAQAVNVLFWPGWFGTGESTPAEECLAAGAEGNWTFVGGSALASNGFLPSQEAQAASVQSARTPAGNPLLWMQAIVPSGYWDGNGRNGRFYWEFGGGRALAAQWLSAINVQHPAVVQLITWNDAGEGSYLTRSAALAYLNNGQHWPYVTNGFVQDWYQDTSGIQAELAYFIQWYKTGQQPGVASDTLIAYNRPQLTAASYAPANDPLGKLGSVYGILGDPAGLQDAVNVTVFAKASCMVSVSGVGPVNPQFAPAGISHLVFAVTQAGTPQVVLTRAAQVVRQVTGHAIAQAATLVDVNVASVPSVPGIKFTLSVPRPAGLAVDRVGLMCRANAAGSKALGVRSLAATDMAASPPAVFAQASLNNPAAVGKTLDLATAAGDDALGQYTYGYGNGLLVMYADPLDASQPPLAYITSTANNNLVYDVPGKPIPSRHTLLSCQIVCTNISQEGQAGVAMVSSANGYSGKGVFAYVEETGTGGNPVLTIKYEDNILSDTNSTGPTVLGTLTINQMSPGEVADLTLEDDGQALTATVTPGNQQN